MDTVSVLGFSLQDTISISLLPCTIKTSLIPIVLCSFPHYQFNHSSSLGLWAIPITSIVTSNYHKHFSALLEIFTALWNGRLNACSFFPADTLTTTQYSQDPHLRLSLLCLVVLILGSLSCSSTLSYPFQLLVTYCGIISGSCILLVLN